MNRRTQTMALQAARQAMREAEHLAVLVAKASGELAELDARRAELVTHRDAMLAGLGHFGGLEVAARLSGTDTALVRRLMRKFPAEQTAENVQAFEHRSTRRKRPVAPATPAAVSAAPTLAAPIMDAASDGGAEPWA